MLVRISIAYLVTSITCIGVRAQQHVHPNRDVDQTVLRAQMLLAEFGYGTRFTARLDTPTVEAITEYQKRSGLRITRSLNTETIKHLEEDATAVRFPNTGAQAYHFDIGQEAIGARGIWLPQGSISGADHDPVTTSIFCTRVPEPGFPTGFCEDISVMIDPIDGFRSSSQWYVKLSVTRWDNSIVEAEGADPIHGNIKYVYRFDPQTRTATKLLLRSGALPPFPATEQYRLADPLSTLWKWKDDEAWNARRRIMLMPEAQVWR